MVDKVAAFCGVVILNDNNGFLLGGTKRHESAPFASRNDALAWAETIATTNWNRPGFELANITITVKHVMAVNPIR
jgi:hypothetical protein